MCNYLSPREIDTSRKEPYFKYFGYCHQFNNLKTWVITKKSNNTVEKIGLAP